MWFFAQLTLGLAFWEVLLPRLGLRGWARRTRSSRYKNIASEFRRLAIRMGGVMIKVGQFLSARLDVLPAEITDELAGLQDEVPPEDFAAIRRLAEAELGAALEAVFEQFDPEPLAAASLGQVHLARLPSDAPEAGRFRDVVVKIQRPHIEELIDVDFSALRRFGSWIQNYRPIRKRIDVLALISELSDTVHAEIDYLAEGGNAETFASNFASRKRVRVPGVAWSHTTLRVLTLENVYAIKITDYDAITAAGVSRGQVASVLFDTYLKQIFEDEFFHADPHPGNLFVSPVPAAGNHRASWKLTFVDFGMVGTVPQALRQGLRDLLVGIGTRDAAKVVRAYQTMGVLLPGANVELLQRAEAQLFDRFWGMTMSQLRNVDHAEMRQFGLQFRELMYDMPFQLPQNLLLLGRTLAILSGMCTGLDPDFNLWEHLSPYARDLLAGESAGNWEGWLDQILEFGKKLIALPARGESLLGQLERGELRLHDPLLARQLYYVEGAALRVAGGVVFSALVIAGTMLFNSGNFALSYIFWTLAGITFAWTALLARGHAPRGA